jgi:hypothetical protein
LAAIGIACLAVGCSGDGGSSRETGTSATERPGETVWLCDPSDAANPCLETLDGVTVSPDGRRTRFDRTPTEDPAVDCFYTYPTLGHQSDANADLSVGPELDNVAISQASMFSATCDVYAPVYRQYTLRAPVTAEVRDLAYGDVLAAWNEYLEEHNSGRGVVLIGHSQGAFHLARLVAEQMDGRPAVRRLLVSAILPGANLHVRRGRLAGGRFRNVPACGSKQQTGCVIAYQMALSEPPGGSDFGRLDSGYWLYPDPRPDPDRYRTLCVNPAELSGDSGRLRPLVHLGALFGQAPGRDGPWQEYPGAYRAKCKSSRGSGWLEVEPPGDRNDSRPDVTGLFARGSHGDLHVGDMSLTLGNLVEIVRSQSAAWTAGTGAVSPAGGGR